MSLGHAQDGTDLAAERLGVVSSRVSSSWAPSEVSVGLQRATRRVPSGMVSVIVAPALP